MGGEFFTQTVFVIMSSIACSQRVLDFFVVKRSEEADKLREEIEEELRGKPLFESQNEQYLAVLDKIESLLEQIDECVNGAVKSSKRWAIIWLVLAFLFLATGTAKFLGFIPLITFVTILYVRVDLLKDVNSIQSKLEGECKHFKDLRKAYNTVRNELAARAGAKVDKAIHEKRRTP